jgi:hypothetical protein
MYFSVLRGDVPWQYSLGCAETALFVHLSPTAINTLRQWIGERHVAVDVWDEENGVPSFATDLCVGDSFGFNACCAISASEVFPSGVALRVNLPVVQTARLCEMCEGGEERHSCFFCNGTGKTYTSHFESLTPLAKTLQLVLQAPWSACAESVGVSSNDGEKQLLECSIALHSDGTASMSGAYSARLVQWLALQVEHDDLCDEVERAMRIVHTHMMPGNTYHECRLLLRGNGWLSINVPGNASGIDPDSPSFSGAGKPYGFLCHNMDNVVRMLTVLVGLGALEQYARSRM